eukprot:593073-Prymnesium_polylepis.1
MCSYWPASRWSCKARSSHIDAWSSPALGSQTESAWHARRGSQRKQTLHELSPARTPARQSPAWCSQAPHLEPSCRQHVECRSCGEANGAPPQAHSAARCSATRTTSRTAQMRPR